MARHQGSLSVTGTGELEIRCLCGWSERLAVETELHSPFDAMNRHHTDLRGPSTYGAHLSFGWNDDAPVFEPPPRP
jgi:hypothetical protein